MLDVVIIGAGPTGIYAGFYAGMRKLSGVIIESLSYPGGQLTTLYKEKPIYDIPGFSKISAGDFIDKLVEQYQEFKDQVPLHLSTKVTALEVKEGFYLLHTDQGSFETKTIVIASGGGTFSPRLLSVPGADSKPNIIYRVDKLADFKGKRVVVLGGGDSALDWAVLLSEHGASVKIIHRRNDFRAHEDTIDKFKKSGEILTPYNVASVLGDELATGLVIEHAETRETQTIPTDYIFVNYGFAPQPSLYQAWGFEVEGSAIKVSTTMETNIPGIYAVGNAASYPGKIKSITPGFGEVTLAISAINNRLFPQKNNNAFYSSSIIKK